MSRKNFIFVLGTILLLTVFAVANFSHPSVADTAGQERTIRVIGESVVTAVPDQCIIILAVETQSTDSKQAVADNSKITNDVIKALKGFGLADDQIKTGNYNLYSYVDYIDPSRSNEKPTTQYKAYNTLTITLNKLDQSGQVIDTAVTAGANQVQSIRFELKNSEASKLKALETATIQAKAKGEAIAKGAGVTLKGIKSISEEGTSYTPYRTMYAEDKVMMEGGSAYPPTPIVPGDIEISARVVVEYVF